METVSLILGYSSVVCTLVTLVAAYGAAVRAKEIKRLEKDLIKLIVKLRRSR